MQLISVLSLLPLLFHVVSADVPETPINPTGEPEQYNLKAKVDVKWPDNSSPLGVTVINGHVSRINVDIENFEEEPITIQAIGGNLLKADRTGVLRNLTAAKVSQEIAPMQVMSVPYSFITNMHPQDVVLELGLIISTNGGKIVQYTAYNGTVSVAEPETSLLNPQILFLYLLIIGLVAGGGYLAYETWVVPMMPKKKRTRVVVPEARTSAVEVPTGKGGYDESWIPQHHLQRPTAQKVRTGSTPKVRSAKKAE